MAQELTFAERRAIQRAKFEAEWNERHAPGKLIGDDPINPHKHYAHTEPGKCRPDANGVCHIPHLCRCPIIFACMGGCYKTEA